MKNIFLSLTVLSFLSACATSPDKMAAASVSPFKYSKYDCEQIQVESDRVQRRVMDLYTQLDSTATKDAWQMGVGLVLLWPTLFFLEGGDGPEASEYRMLKGEYEALQQASIQKKCGFDFIDIEQALKDKAAKDKELAEANESKKKNFGRNSK